MQESYSEVPARHADPESYAGDGDIAGVATTGAHAGPVLSSESVLFPCADTLQTVEGNIAPDATGKTMANTAESKTWMHEWKIQAREPGDPIGLPEEVAGSGPRTPLEVMRA